MKRDVAEIFGMVLGALALFAAIAVALAVTAVALVAWVTWWYTLFAAENYIAGGAVVVGGVAALLTIAVLFEDGGF